MLSVINVVMLNVANDALMLSVIMLNVVILSVVAPLIELSYSVVNNVRFRVEVFKA
jgi:hypothetical protein